MNKVLIIEDSSTFSEYIRLNIEDDLNQVAILKAKTYSEAKEVLASHHQEIFCVIVDLNLSDINPIDGIADIREAYPHIAVVVITGEIGKGALEDVLEMDIADYITRKDQQNIEYVAKLISRIAKNRNNKVLVVDDSRTARAEMERLLKIQHYQVIQAQSGEEALSLLLDHPDIKLVLLDCHMDGIDGVQTCLLMRESFSKDQLSIIGVSGKGSNNMSAAFIKSGANDFLVKPFLKEEFYCRIGQNIDYLETISLLQEANELKNQTIGMAAHDIRGPIGIIKNLGDLLLSEKDTNKILKYTQHIITTSQNTLRLLDSLLNLSVIESGKIKIDKRDMNLYQLLKERVEFYQYVAEKKNIKIDFSGDSLDNIFCDSSKIMQVIDNLLSNAIKYSPSNSSILVNLSETQEWQSIEIIDSGVGVEAADVHRLFSAYERFGHTTGGESSTGLGLVICKNLIEAHNGHIGYKKHDPAGSNFYFSLPRKNNRSCAA